MSIHEITYFASLQKEEKEHKEWLLEEKCTNRNIFSVIMQLDKELKDSDLKVFREEVSKRFLDSKCASVYQAPELSINRSWRILTEILASNFPKHHPAYSRLTKIFNGVTDS